MTASSTSSSTTMMTRSAANAAFLVPREQPPDLGVAGRVGTLRVDDGDVGVERRHGVDACPSPYGLPTFRMQRVGRPGGPSRSSSRSGKNGSFVAPAAYRATIPKWLYSSSSRLAHGPSVTRRMR